MNAELVPSRRHRRSGAADDGRRLQPLGLPWILPALVLCVGLIYYCIGTPRSSPPGTGTASIPDPERVGAENYVRIAQDPIFWQTIRHTVVFFVVTFVVQTALGFFFAVLLHSKVKLAVVYKVIIFIPVVLAPAITAPVFRQIFAPDGQFNALLEFFGLGFLAQPWIGQESTALPVIMAITVWHWTGLTFVLYFAAMGQIDQSIIEAARIDGAGNFRTLVHIIWPGVRGTTLAMAILERHRRPEDVRRPLPRHRRRSELRHGVPRHLHLPEDHPAVARRLRRGPVDHPARAGPGDGSHPAGPRRREGVVR